MAQANNDYAKDKIRNVADDVVDTAADFADKASRQIGKTVEKAESTVRQMAERSGEAGERVQEVATNIRGAVDKSVKDQPMATLAVAAMVGFALGALWKS